MAASEESNLHYSKICPRASNKEHAVPMAEAAQEQVGWLFVGLRTGDSINLLEEVAHGKRRQPPKKFISSTRRRRPRGLHNTTQVERKNKSMRRRMKYDDSGLNERTSDGKTRRGRQTTLSKRRVKELQER